ncbi:10272_t:CDS:2 [Entrophospora sp. SA101]|nr:10272_t:CDS:2 [Entrophospora sp. SA101]
MVSDFLSNTTQTNADKDNGGGSSDNFAHGEIIRIVAGLFAVTATLLSTMSIWSHLKNYRKPALQRYVVRIIIMVPIYAISSWISLTSTNAAFYVDAIRDIYEAFVIYCFFNLLVNCLGGERSLLILLHGRPPTPHLFPVNFFLRDIDIGDPYAFLFIKRGILQYVYVKPILSLLTMLLKWANTYQDGHIGITNGYIYISLIYNVSCSLCFYCLIIFYVCTKDDLRPYRPIPKFLCVKAVIFFSFWQGFILSILVYAGIIHDTTTDSAEGISVSIQDFLITFEMVMGSIAHWYAFSFKDYIDPNYRSGRMPIRYAFKDCMGFKDVLEDTLETIRGSRFNYRTFEPAEGMAYIGPSRTARIMAGLRFTGGGSGKYWLPGPNNSRSSLSSERADDDDKNSLNFPDPTPDDEVETMYDYSRRLGRFGDYNFPNKKGKARAKDIFNNNDDDNEEYDFFEDDELINNRIRNGSSSKNRQLSDPNVSPFRIGCIDLVREIPNIEDDDDDETDEFDPLGTNRTRHLSNSLKSLEKNIWKEDDYFNL